jgi:hypothetical protein
MILTIFSLQEKHFIFNYDRYCISTNLVPLKLPLFEGRFCVTQCSRSVSEELSVSVMEADKNKIIFSVRLDDNAGFSSETSVIICQSTRCIFSVGSGSSSALL